MAYNNYFPAGYQQMYYPQQNQMQGTQMSLQNQPQLAPNSNLIWVQGEAGAKSYLVAPNQTVQLWDSENQVIYLKSADGSGMPSIKVIDYTVRSPQSTQDEKKEVEGKFISKDELNGLRDELESLKHDVEKIKHARVRLTKIEKDDDYE